MHMESSQVQQQAEAVEVIRHCATCDSEIVAQANVGGPPSFSFCDDRCWSLWPCANDQHTYHEGHDLDTCRIPKGSLRCVNEALNGGQRHG